MSRMLRPLLVERYERAMSGRLIQFADRRLTQSDPYVRVMMSGVTMARTEVVNNSKMQSTRNGV